MAPERRAGCRRTPRSSPERRALWFGEGGGCGAGFDDRRRLLKGEVWPTKGLMVFCCDGEKGGEKKMRVHGQVLSEESGSGRCWMGVAGCGTAWHGCQGGLPEVAVAPTEKVGHPRRSLDRGCCRVRGKGSRLMAVMDIAEGLRGEEERRLMEMASRLEGVRLSLEMCEHGGTLVAAMEEERR